METGQIYFSTATIYNWYHLLAGKAFKNIVIESLENLSNRNLVDVFSFVIMPSHIHLIWRLNALNGKETAQGSFFKFTAHAFQKKLRFESPGYLEAFGSMLRIKNMNSGKGIHWLFCYTPGE